MRRGEGREKREGWASGEEGCKGKEWRRGEGNESRLGEWGGEREKVKERRKERGWR